MKRTKNERSTALLVLLVTIILASCDSVTSGGDYESRRADLPENESPLDSGTIESGKIERMLTFATGSSDVYGVAELKTSAGNEAILAARFDGDAWQPIGTHRFKNWASSMAVSEPYVYVAENAQADGDNALKGRVYRWDGSEWTQLGAGFDGRIFSVAAEGEIVYAGGTFSGIAGRSANNIAKWNGSDWEPLASGLEYTSDEDPTSVYDIAIHEGNIYVAGAFDRAGDVETAFAAQWDGAEWHAMPGLQPRPDAQPGSGSIRDLMADGDKIYAIGLNVNLVEGDDPFPLLLWEEGIWKDAGPSVVGFRIAKAGSRLYAAGSANSDGFSRASGVFSWDGTTLYRVFEKPDTQFSRVASDGNNVFIGGVTTIRTDGGVRPEYVNKRWDGSQWNDIGEVDISSLE